MSRSVNCQSGAALVKYTYYRTIYGEYNPETDSYEGDDYNEPATQDEAESLFEGLAWSLREALPSFEEVPSRQQASRWDPCWSAANRECWPILRNGSAVVYLSEYCGLVSVSVVPADEIEGDGPRLGIQLHWIRSVEKRIDDAIERVGERLVCCGHFSNGEGVFRPVSRRAELCAIVNGEAI